VTTPQARKGKEAEREVAGLLAYMTGWPVRRRLMNGRSDDGGDLVGLPRTCAQVKNYADIRAAVSVGLADVRRQRVTLGARYGVVLCRRRGRVGAQRYVAVMDLEDLARLLLDAQHPPCPACNYTGVMGGDRDEEGGQP
jgi:hypothetical protein